MPCTVGIDIGAVSATAAVISDQELNAASAGLEACSADRSDGRFCYVTACRRTRGKPIHAATELLDEIIAAVGADEVSAICLTGSGAKATAAKLGAGVVNEFKAIAAGVEVIGLEAATIFEMGGETSKYLRTAFSEDGSVGVVDYATNGDCAAGTGSFIDQQAGRLRYDVEKIGEICAAADRAAQVAGRCSVFAKSDMIHAQQKGYTPPEVLRGLCDAVARNFRTAVVRSHPVEPPVAFIGGVAANAAVARAMRDTFDLDESQLVVPQWHAHLPAIGAAVLAEASAKATDLSKLAELRAASDSAHGVFPTQDPLSMADVLLLRDRVEPYEAPFGDEPVDVYVGLDVGSVSTNVVAVDDDGRVVTEIYTRTQGRPIEVVGEALKRIEVEWGDRLNVRGVGTTGSGRELIGQLVGADTINDEITAHKTGATFIGRKMLGGRVPDTIFEIGGQDSKYISLDNGVVVDFTMNEACAAGTGSFLEERAEELDIAIKGEFAELALSSEAPIRLGERCTVFMERDVNSYMQRGAEKPDLVAGLAFSVVYNYINRVVRGRPIGECIFFQGGTAYNDAVAAAFAEVTGKEIIVPPHNGVIGAIGAALLAREKMTAAEQGLTTAPGAEPVAVAAEDGAPLGEYVSEFDSRADVARSRFRGYDMSLVDYTLREFTCKGCSNHCRIQEFTVEGEKTYWGDKCSDRFRKRSKAERSASIDDLFALREQLLLDDGPVADVPDRAPRVGIPRTMFALEQMPFWRTFFSTCGMQPVLSDPTNKQIVQAGLETVVAEPCFPIIVAHGHVVALCERDDLEYVFVPNIVSNATRWMDNESHLCPWHQTLPFVCRQAPVLQPHAGRFLSPTLNFREGEKLIRRQLTGFLDAAGLRRRLGLSKRDVAAAVDAAYAAQNRFHERYRSAGAEAMATLQASGERGIVLVGRPYNVHDAGVSLSVARKLRDYYGVNVVPLDALDLDAEDVRDINDNMYWDLGRRIIATARIVARHENLDIIYITNFKCGPDSFIKHFIRRASGKPFLSLQFDGHSNDAGVMTRCEAYLDSKGILRPWKAEESARQLA